MSGKLYVGPYLAQPSPSSAEVGLSNLNSAISAQPLLGANTVNAMYRVSMAIIVTTPGTAGIMNMSCLCQNSAGETRAYVLPSQSVLPLTGDAMQSGQFIVDANGSGDIIYNVSFVGVTVGALRYKIRIAVERLTAL